MTVNSSRAVGLAALLLCTLSSPALGQPAGTVQAFVSDDADDTEVAKWAAGAHWRYASPQDYRGLSLESMRVRFGDGRTWRDSRAFFAFAGSAGDREWNGRVGTDGHALIGNAALVKQTRVRQEYFVERDIVETPRGVDGLYHTFVGAAYDLPLDRQGRQQLTALVGVQDFTGDNVRTHLRARYIAVVKPEWGLSLQLRARAFHSSHPGEYDYYSPRRFVEAMPAVQVRRRFADGWSASVALGYGQQKDTGRPWRPAALAEASITSPRREGRSYFRVGANYTNTPSGTGGSYGYRQFTMEWIAPF